MRTANVLTAFVLLSLVGCATEQRVKLDPLIPHQVSQPAQLTVWSIIPNGKAVEIEVDIDAGWWVASPVLLEHAP